MDFDLQAFRVWSRAQKLFTFQSTAAISLRTIGETPPLNPGAKEEKKRFLKKSKEKNEKMAHCQVVGPADSFLVFLRVPVSKASCVGRIL